MAISLQKGQKVDLKKSTGDTLKRVIVGLGWDQVEQKRGFFSLKPREIDCDASALVCIGGRVANTSDVVYFGNKRHHSGAIYHTGDNLTGAGDGDDEQIIVDLQNIPANYDKLVFVVNIYQARERAQHFGMIRNAFIRIVDQDTNQEMCRYNLSDSYDGMTAMIFGEIYRKDGGWKFSAINASHSND